MGAVNLYLPNESSGTVATDLWGGNNGTLAGASLPVINNGGMLGTWGFTGGNGNTPGDYNRIELTASDFQYASTDDFSTFIIFKSSKSDAETHNLFSMMDASSLTAMCFSQIDGSEYYMARNQTSSGNYVQNYITSNISDGAWHSATLCMDSTVANSKGYFDSVDKTTVTGTPSGNYYTANSKPTLGVQYVHATTNYRRDLTGEIGMLANYDEKLDPADIMGWEMLWNGCL